MLPKYPISPPAPYVSAVAVGFADPAGNMRLVGQGGPLPVTTVRPASPAPMAGSTAESGIVGPFATTAGQPMHLELRGEWTGRVELHRSIDGGTTRNELTLMGMPWAQFTTNANETVWQEVEENVTFYLDIQLVSGELNYRLSQ